MPSDRLFELALAFRKTNLWKRLYDTELFAFSAPDGEIAYACVMGHNGQHLALGIYPGSSGLDSFRRILQAGDDLPPASRHELLFSQDCVQCSFENTDDLIDDQLEQARRYARSNGISFRGKHAFPAFTRYQPYRMPWPVRTQEDEALLCRGLEAALDLDTLLRQESKQVLGLRPCIPCQGEIPFLSHNEMGGPVAERVTLPPETEPDYPAPMLEDELTVRRISRLKRSGTWQCELMWAQQAVADDDGGAPCFPAFLLCWSDITDQVFTTDLVTLPFDHPDKVLGGLCEQMLRANLRPKTLLVRERRTYALLSRLCAALGIALKQQDELEPLENAELSYYQFSEDETEEDELSMLVEMLSDLSPVELAHMPGELREQLEALNDADLLPPELSHKLALAFAPAPSSKVTRLPKKGSAKGKPKRKYADCSYVISVSLGTGCYRHIRLSGGDTLDDLAQDILDAFDFENDHLHLFGMDNRTWDSRDCYSNDPDSTDLPMSRHSSRVRLGQLGLVKGMAFKFLFDFGDEWVFQCKVLRELAETTDVAEVVRSKGDAPSQYDYDDDDYDDE